MLFRDLGGEAVLLQLETGRYFGLDDVGTRMWQLLADNGELEATYRSLLDEFEVEPERLKHDLMIFVDRLAGQSLVTLDAD